MDSRHLIIGYGEVGQALHKFFNDAGVIDNGLAQHGRGRSFRKVMPDFDPDVMHICFPYSDNFITDVKNYQEEYKPKYTVIHSTVPVGTSTALSATSSPIRGLHPNLESGIKTFVKFLAGSQASEVADYFRRVGIRVCLFDRQENAEALKLFDTEYYRVCIEFTHRVKKYCDEHNLNFHEVYTLANQTYNEGYIKLGHPEFVRPVLQAIMKPIGGHCVMQNKELI